MDLLARRDYSSQELIKKLSSRYADRSLVEEQVDKLTAENLQNDQRYVDNFVRSRIRKGQGPVRIINELTQKGIAKALALHIFEELAVDWEQVVIEVSKSKYGSTQPRDDKEKAKRVRFFQYRGFEFEQIRQVIMC